jgi:hypothetical protein
MEYYRNVVLERRKSAGRGAGSRIPLSTRPRSCPAEADAEVDAPEKSRVFVLTGIFAGNRPFSLPARDG